MKKKDTKKKKKTKKTKDFFSVPRKECKNCKGTGTDKYGENCWDCGGKGYF